MCIFNFYIANFDVNIVFSMAIRYYKIGQNNHFV
jgi:hypothetical protein